METLNKATKTIPTKGMYQSDERQANARINKKTLTFIRMSSYTRNTENNICRVNTPSLLLLDNIILIQTYGRDIIKHYFKYIITLS